VNRFFGEKITVSGLITGQDLIEQLKEGIFGDRLFLSCSMLREGEDVFLDDITVLDVEKALQVKVDIVKSSGYDFLNAILKGWK
jgi:NifB/MoaA-like Fe-S oxidoreductase